MLLKRQTWSFFYLSKNGLHSESVGHLHASEQLWRDPLLERDLQQDIDGLGLRRSHVRLLPDVQASRLVDDHLGADVFDLVNEVAVRTIAAVETVAVGSNLSKG